MMRKATRLMAWAVTVSVAGAALCGCANRGSDGNGDRGMDDSARAGERQSASFTGTLRGGMAGIGGEHTGWALDRADGAGQLELNVSAVADAARRLEGQRVRVTGRMTRRDYVERGPTEILVVERIEAADPRSSRR